MESFLGLLKTELVHLMQYSTHAEATTNVTKYMEIFYNRQQRQAMLDYFPLAAFAQKLQKEQTDKAT